MDSQFQKKEALLRRLLSERDLSEYKKGLLSRAKIAGKIITTITLAPQKNNPDIKRPVDYVVYIKDPGHATRFKEYKSYIKERSSESKNFLFIYNGSSVDIINDLEKSGQIIKFSLAATPLQALSLTALCAAYTATGSVRFLLLALDFYYKLTLKKFEDISKFTSHIKNKKLILILFNDQPIQASTVERALREKGIIHTSICYQHGLIGNFRRYFPCKSDYFFSYTDAPEINTRFKESNKYGSKLEAVGNLKYNKKYKEIAQKNNSSLKVLLVLDPNWKNYFRIKNKIQHRNIYVEHRLHPGMKFKWLFKLFLSATGRKIALCNDLASYDLVVAEVSTMLLEALAEGTSIARLISSNFSRPYFLNTHAIPELTELSSISAKYAIRHCDEHKKELTLTLQKYFG